jgi:3-deoxy-D-manno-octulosonic-acid transferase
MKILFQKELSMLFPFVLTVYQIIQIVLIPFLFVYSFSKQMYAHDTSYVAREVCGDVPASDPSRHVVWIHGYNAGEILSVQALVQKIQAEVPNAACYITSSTPEGVRVAQNQVKPDYVSLLPYDNTLSIAWAFHQIKPSSIILLEHEVWPTLLMYAQFRHIPIYLLNAQMTSATAHNLQSYNFFYKGLFNNFSTIFSQSETDKALFVQEGVDTAKVIPTGNIKALNVVKKKEKEIIGHEVILDAASKNKKSLILLVGSVHRGELDIYLNLFSLLKKEVPNLKIIFAPRHKDWEDELVAKVTATGYPFFLWNDQAPVKTSNVSELIEQIHSSLLVDNDILLVNTFGKLFQLSAVADLYFPGGTFIPIGGHNLVEAAVWANPIIVGPHHENTKDIADELSRHNAIIKVENAEQLLIEARKLLSSDDKRHELGERALNWLSKEATRVEFYLDAIVDMLKENVQQPEFIKSV